MRYWLFPLVVSIAACSEVIDLDPLDQTPPVEASVRPPAISGGTLAVTGDGVAVAADPDRDVVHVVDLATKKVRHSIALNRGDEPGRVAIGDNGRAYVVLRAAGSIATIDLTEGTVVARQSLCSAPRGISFDASTSILHVACADGTLVQIDDASGDIIARETLASDLRDVVALGGKVYASRFRSAEIVASTGGTVEPNDGSGRVARVAWKTWTAPSAEGGPARIFMLHQVASVDPIAIERVSDIDGESDPAYGGGGSFCSPTISNPAITIVPDNEGPVTFPLPNLPLAVDAAVSPDGQWLAVAVPGAPPDRSSVLVQPVGSGNGCDTPLQDDAGYGQVTAVAFASNDLLVMQSREPAQLVIRTGDPFRGLTRTIPLPGEARFDSGHEIFHRATESGLSCASCHPEGGDDGHVWFFTALGERRTQPLDIGLEGTAPFHWDGDMDDLDMIMDEVLSHRMGGLRQSAERRDSFTRWLFERELPPAAIDQDATMVAAGSTLFAEHGCASCHAGDRMLSNATVSIRGVQLQVPSLRRVALRPPYMHDGRAETLEAAVLDMIQSTSPIGTATQDDVAAIAAFLRTK